MKKAKAGRAGARDAINTHCSVARAAGRRAVCERGDCESATSGKTSCWSAGWAFGAGLAWRGVAHGPRALCERTDCPATAATIAAVRNVGSTIWCRPSHAS